jgi:hypothetical protein
MPAHTSHLLQPLDVSCFAPLKAAYGHEVSELARQGVFHIDKTEFLSIYPRVRRSVFTEKNIQSGFRATGLVPPCPERLGRHLHQVLRQVLRQHGLLRHLIQSLS